MTGVAGHLRAGEHQQVGAVAAHPGGQVVEPEQALQSLRVLLVAFQAVDQRELLVDQ